MPEDQTDKGFRIKNYQPYYNEVDTLYKNMKRKKVR